MHLFLFLSSRKTMDGVHNARGRLPPTWARVKEKNFAIVFLRSVESSCSFILGTVTKLQGSSITRKNETPAPTCGSWVETLRVAVRPRQRCMQHASRRMVVAS